MPKDVESSNIARAVDPVDRRDAVLIYSPHESKYGEIETGVRYFVCDRRPDRCRTLSKTVWRRGRSPTRRCGHLRSKLRRRLIVTHRVPAIVADPSQANLLFWNPAGASFEEALSLLGIPNGSVGVIGGTDVFGLFLQRYDFFYLTRAPAVQLPGGRPVFSEVPIQTPEEVLAAHGLVPGHLQILDAAKELTVVRWQRVCKHRKVA